MIFCLRLPTRSVQQYKEGRMSYNLCYPGMLCPSTHEQKLVQLLPSYASCIPQVSVVPITYLQHSLLHLTYMFLSPESTPFPSSGWNLVQQLLRTTRCFVLTTYKNCFANTNLPPGMFTSNALDPRSIEDIGSFSYLSHNVTAIR